MPLLIPSRPDIYRTKILENAQKDLEFGRQKIPFGVFLTGDGAALISTWEGKLNETNTRFNLPFPLADSS
jgi:hypothetical protein